MRELTRGTTPHFNWACGVSNHAELCEHWSPSSIRGEFKGNPSMLHTISETLSVSYPGPYLVTSVQETLHFHFHCEGMTGNLGNSDPAAVMAAGHSRSWARGINREDLRMLPHACSKAFGRLERWLLHLESEAQAHCAERLQAAMQEARSAKARFFYFSLGLTPESYSPPVMQAILAPSSKCSSKAAALEAHRYQVCVGKQTGQGFARHSKGLHSSGGGAPRCQRPSCPSCPSGRTQQLRLRRFVPEVMCIRRRGSATPSPASSITFDIRGTICLCPAGITPTAPTARTSS